MSVPLFLLTFHLLQAYLFVAVNLLLNSFQSTYMLWKMSSPRSMQTNQNDVTKLPPVSPMIPFDHLRLSNSITDKPPSFCTLLASAVSPTHDIRSSHFERGKKPFISSAIQLFDHRNASNDRLLHSARASKNTIARPAPLHNNVVFFMSSKSQLVLKTRYRGPRKTKTLIFTGSGWKPLSDPVALFCLLAQENGTIMIIHQPLTTPWCKKWILPPNTTRVRQSA